MPSDTQTAPVSKKGLLAGRIMSGLIIAFLAFDGVFKFVKPASGPRRGDIRSPGLVPQPRAGSRDRFIGIHCPLCDSEYLRSWRDPADWLSWWRHCHAPARR